MTYTSVSGSLFKKMVINGAINLKNDLKEIDDLNVFPVPDGDTGPNMSMTMMSGVRDIQNSESISISEISKTLSRGLLMGARGNSGVILSQFFRGIYTAMENIKGSAATVNEFIDCLVSGYKVAYKAVMTPVEGTILTVMREAGEKIDETRSEFNDVESLKPITDAMSGFKNFGLIWDIQHTHRAYGRDFEEFYSFAKPYVRHVHIKDFSDTDKALCDIGKGDIPIREIVDRLVADGYDGCFSLEWEKRWHPELSEIEQALDDFVRIMR